MDAHLFRRFCDAALPGLQNALIEKIQSPAKGHLTLAYFDRKRKRQLWLRFERQHPFCFITEPAGAGTRPDAWVMRLRKHAAGSRIAAIVPHYLARRLWFLLAGGDAKGPKGENVWLCLDLRDGASLVFSDDAPEEERMIWPEPRSVSAALENWRDWPVLTPDLRRTLQELEERDRWALVGDLQDGGGDVFLYENASGEIARVQAWPLAARQRGELRELAGEDVLPLLERAGQDMVIAGLARNEARAQAAPGQKKIRKLRKLLEKLSDEERRLEGMAARKNDALALQASLWNLAPDFRGSSLDLPGHAGPIALDARFGPRENMERLFRLAKRGERGLSLLRERRENIRNELDALEAAPRPLLAGGDAGARKDEKEAPNVPKIRLPRNVQLFTSSDGYALLRGRDARGNQAARKLAKPYDYWLHVENGPGAHVIIRRRHPGDIVPETTLLEAGSLAAGKSWLKDAATAPIVYAEARHISPMRNAPPGTMRIDRIFTSRVVPVRPELEERLAGG